VKDKEAEAGEEEVWAGQILGKVPETSPQVVPQISAPQITTRLATTTVFSGADTVCSFIVRATGVEDLQAPRMGDYTQQDFLHDGRAVYGNAKGQFLYYWGPFKGWRIGDSYGSPFAGVKSLAYEDARCPDEATGWQVYAGTGWTGMYNIQIERVNLGAVPIESLASVPLHDDRPLQRLRSRRQRHTQWLDLRSHSTAIASISAAAGLVALLAAVFGARKAMRSRSQSAPRTYGPLGAPLQE